MSNEVSLGEFEGPLGELVQQCKSNRSRFDEFKLWLKKVVFFHLIVNYSQTLAQMIGAGQYDWVNPDITETKFPMDKRQGTVEVDAELIHIGRDISSENALVELDRRGYRAGTAEELLAFGAKNPEKQQEFPIVALGTVRRLFGYWRVLCLSGDGSGRGLFLDWFADDWFGICRFLAVRK